MSVQRNVGADGSWSLVVGMELGHRAWWNKKAPQANVKHIKMEARLWEGKFQLYDSTSLRVEGLHRCHPAGDRVSLFVRDSAHFVFTELFQISRT